MVYLVYQPACPTACLPTPLPTYHLQFSLPAYPPTCYCLLLLLLQALWARWWAGFTHPPATAHRSKRGWS